MKDPQIDVPDELDHGSPLGKLVLVFVGYKLKPFDLSETFGIKGIQFILHLSCKSTSQHHVLQ